MTIIEIAALSNGAHRNQTGAESCPDGWAVVPDELLADWEACAPFAEITVEAGVVSSIVPLDPPPAPEQLPDTEIQPEELADYTATYAAMVAAGEISITDVPRQYRDGVQYTVIQTLVQEE